MQNADLAEFVALIETCSVVAFRVSVSPYLERQVRALVNARMLALR